MSSKRALIVDDSKTAQFKLSRKLETYNLVIDTALSAEDALSYLAYQVPDVIFMDHSMKGMNGLDAVKIIKSNSATATIPVVMYTAQSGELYLSQARAMGAIEVLSKDVMTESDVQRVMASLKLNAKMSNGTEVSSSENSLERAPARDSDLMQIRDQVSNALDIQQGQLRRELQDNTRLLVNRFMREIRGLRDEMDRQKKLDRELLVMNIENSEEPGLFDMHPAWLCALGALVVALIWAIWSAAELRNENETLVQNEQTFKQSLVQQQERFDAQKEQASRQINNETGKQAKKLLNALVWAINQQGQFDFSEIALGESRQELMAGLLEHLSAVNFAGTLRLEVHNGDFCVSRDNQGGLALPDRDTPVSSCVFLSTTAASFDSASQTSLSFLNLLQSYPIIADGNLKVEIKTHGLSKPRTRYPNPALVTGSDEWNAVALLNNRLMVTLLSSDDS